MLTWIEVAANHSTQAGVSIKNNKVSSILIGNNKYANSIKKDKKIEYTFKNIGMGKYWHKHFENAVKEKYTFTVYKKEKSNVWNDLGKYTVISVTLKQEDFVVTLTGK